MSRGEKEGYGSVHEMDAGVPVMFAKYGSDMLERVWQSLFKKYYRVVTARRGSKFGVEHIDTAKGRKRGELARARKIDEGRTIRHSRGGLKRARTVAMSDWNVKNVKESNATTRFVIRVDLAKLYTSFRRLMGQKQHVYIPHY